MFSIKENPFPLVVFAKINLVLLFFFNSDLVSSSRSWPSHSSTSTSKLSILFFIFPKFKQSSVVPKIINELISIITGVGIALAGIVALLSYMNQKKHDEMKKENAKLENEIKKLQLTKLKNDVNGSLI